MDKHEVEVWLSVDSEGNAAVSIVSADDARETLAAEGVNADVRTVRILAAIALPQVEDAWIDVPDDAGQIDAAA